MKIEKIAVPQDDFRRLYASLKQDYTMTIGIGSFFVPALHHKFINKALARNISGEWFTSGEYAGKILRAYFENGTRNWSWELRNKLSPPLLFLGPCKFRDVAYLDLRHAYAQIYRKLCLDIAYPRSTGLLPLADVYDELSFWKAARNSVVGLSISTQIDMIKAGRIISIPRKSRFLNFALWHHIQIILNNVAEFAVEHCRAFYCFTDGYFLPMSDVGRLEDFCLRFGLWYNVKYHCKLDLRGIGSYRIASENSQFEKITKPYIAGWGAGSPRRNIEKCERDTLKWFSQLEG